MSEDLTHRALIAPGFVEHGEKVAIDADEDETDEASGSRPEGPPMAPGFATPTRTALVAGETNPPGEALADMIARGLQRRGWTVDYRWTTYVGHALDARRGEHRYDVEVALLDADKGEDAGRWLVTAKRRTGFFKRMFRGGVDPAEQVLLRHDVDATLAADPRSAGGPALWVQEAAWAG